MSDMRKLFLVLALVAQIPHAASLFYRLEPDTTNLALRALHLLQAGLYAVALEGATYYFVQRRERDYSWGFAVASVATNLLYYAHYPATWLDIISFFFISAVLPISIALYSYEPEARTETPPEIVTPKQLADQARHTCICGHVAESGWALGGHKNGCEMWKLRKEATKDVKLSKVQVHNPDGLR